MLIPHKGDRQPFKGKVEHATISSIPEFDFGRTKRGTPILQHHNTGAFTRFVLPKYDGSRPIKLLQIGVSYGLDLVWHFQHTLRHSDSRAVGVDIWWDNRKSKVSGAEIYKQALINLTPYKDKLHLVSGDSKEILQHFPPDADFDLAMVDGNHSADYAYNDGFHALRTVKVGGWVMFDDVRVRRGTPPQHFVWEGFHRLWETHGHIMKVVWDYGRAACIEKTGELE